MSERLSIPSESERFQTAWNLYQSGDVVQAAILARNLAQENYVPANFLLGHIYEFGGDTGGVELERAVRHYRLCAVAGRDATSLRYLARALMKLGPAHYGAALSHLEDARADAPSPEIDLGFAWHYETAPVPNFRLAQRYYMRAAVRGRYLGFFGYSRVARKGGQRLRALMVDCVRIISGVFLFIALGRKTRNEF